VLDRPLDSISQDEPSVKPGLHTPRCGKHVVVWWDPAALKLNAPENFGLRQVDILEPLGAASESIAQYTAWKDARARSVERGQAKDFDVVIATALSEPPPGEASVVTIDSVARAVSTSGGVRFGALLHGILRDSDLTAGREHVHDLGQLHGKLLDASGSEIEAAIDAVVATLQHPLIRRAAAAERCHRELPLLLPLGDGRTLEGVVDLAFLENGEWTVVDFKTDAELSGSKARYERQVQWYVYALSKLTGLPAKGVLLWNKFKVADAALPGL
jgi:ATP-dependent exoDNAse (exonuclease V) beta subunit